MTTLSAPPGPPTTSATAPPPGACLIPMNLEHPQERDLLYNQRVTCGWNKEKIEKWRRAIADGHRTMFWITLPPSEQTTTLQSFDRDEKTIHSVGHIALDLVDSPDRIEPDLEMATGDGEIIEITTLFVLSAFGGLRLGAFAMDEVERLAQVEPYGSAKCRAVTLTTLSSRYFEHGCVEGPEGKGRWAIVGLEPPKRDNALWYTRRGYVAFKEVERYFDVLDDGTAVSWYGVCMRKELAKVGGK